MYGTTTVLIKASPINLATGLCGAQRQKIMDSDDSDSDTMMGPSGDDGTTTEFCQAAQRVQMLAAGLPKDKLLYLYARYKQATVGKCNTLRPGLFDFQGKQKWDAWHGLGAMTKDVAMAEYVAAVKDIDPDWSSEKSGGRGRSGMGVGVSTMCKEEDDICDGNKTVFDWCKDGDAEQMSRLLDEGRLGIDDPDDEGMSLLHWACDRGHIGVTQVLLDHKADVNILDEEGQTPLHYAATCEHTAIVEILLKYGANRALTDNEGCMPLELTSDKLIQEMLRVH
ncbi:acyl-CoA-binding domain-containing protein 6-like [Patiria miniata]|uniref:Acyl-CoA-binding domain-containing protein 6 n=1 Tax=Patiria miniata TaxID=46514 RepID=A0A913Z6C2_PATMI|nr:acyl-CoA-binding domain-containing protein 6-like [Patiria miniata]